jgi:hypothetical protein
MPASWPVAATGPRPTTHADHRVVLLAVIAAAGVSGDRRLQNRPCREAWEPERPPLNGYLCEADTACVLQLPLPRPSAQSIPSAGKRTNDGRCGYGQRAYSPSQNACTTALRGRRDREFEGFRWPRRAVVRQGSATMGFGKDAGWALEPKSRRPGMQVDVPIADARRSLRPRIDSAPPSVQDERASGCVLAGSFRSRDMRPLPPAVVSPQTPSTYSHTRNIL